MSDIKEWNVEDNDFWEKTGKHVANRNLWISIPSLLCGFAVWLYWGIITVQMLNLGFPFAKAELFTLAAIAGLTGATLRIPSSFFIRIAGGRNTIFFTTALLMIPAIGTGIALQDRDTPLWMFQILAFLSGFGGGNFASSMSNISFFFPKRMQGLALGLNAGLGNAGVTHDPGKHFRYLDRKNPRRFGNLDSQCRFCLAGVVDPAGHRRLVRHEQYPH
jgi:NNP family nitrate/nitrite transporter-like MFS transporter